MSASSSIAALYEQVYANPDDDEVRRILADALMAVNDPRGELILFQFNPDADYQRRAMRLVQQHGLSWLGPLRGAVIPLAYERGFLASAQIMDPVRANAARGRAEWATLHSLELTSDVTEPEFLDATARALRTLTKVSREALEALTKRKAAEFPPRLSMIRSTTTTFSLPRLARLPASVRALYLQNAAYVRSDNDLEFHSQEPSS